MHRLNLKQHNVDHFFSLVFTTKKIHEITKM